MKMYINYADVIASNCAKFSRRKKPHDVHAYADKPQQQYRNYLFVNSVLSCRHELVALIHSNKLC